MISNIILDFDGVILESNNVKIDGFYKLFEPFGLNVAKEASEYFTQNAGLSRYDVIRYILEIVLQTSCDDTLLYKYAQRYSDIVKNEVINCKFVSGFQEFIIETKSNLYIVSSSDQEDLRYICNKINISKYFRQILGSPVKKDENIKYLINYYNLNKDETIYIGDSINDYYATIKNGLKFIGRDSKIFDFTTLQDVPVIDDLTQLKNIKEYIC